MVIVGYLGLLVGVGVIYLIGEMEVEYFCNFVVNLGVVVVVIVVLILVGVLVGLMFVL